YLKTEAAAAPAAREVLERALEGGDARAGELLVLYHLIVHPDDRAARSARKAAEKTVALAGEDIDALYLLARASAPESRASREELEVSPWIGALKRVLAREEDHLGALLDLAEFSLDLNPLPARAEALTERAVRVAPALHRVQDLRARALSELDRAGEASLAQRAAREAPGFAATSEGAADEARERIRLGDVAGAQELLERALSQDLIEGPALEELL